MMSLILLLSALFNFLISLQPTSLSRYAPELFPDHLSGAVCGYSKDGQIIYFVREDSTVDKLLIYQATKAGGRWTNEKKLPFSGDYDDMGGRLTSDGRTFYFTSNRPNPDPDITDEWNIWQSHFDGVEWSQAYPSSVNSNREECCPTPIEGGLLFSANVNDSLEWQMLGMDAIDRLNVKDAWQWPSYFDQETGLLFFNSMKRPDTLGKDDIYVSKFDGSSWGPVINLGPEVNSEIYEDGAIVSEDRQWLIFNQHTSTGPSIVMCLPFDHVLGLLDQP